jgi:hypothetical protein
MQRPGSKRSMDDWMKKMKRRKRQIGRDRNRKGKK